MLFELFQRDTTPGRLVIDTKGDLEIDHDFLFDPKVTRWNPLAEPIAAELAPGFFAQAIKDAFGYDDMTTPVMSMYLTFTAAALIDNGFNLTDAPKLLTDAGFRDRLQYKTPLVQQFWQSFEAMGERDRRGETASTLNKFIGLLLDGRVHRLLSVNRKGLRLSALADKTTLVRLPISEYGTDTVALIGSLLLSYLAQIIDAPFSIYVEDANLFARGTLIKMLTTGSISLTLSHQYLDQFDPKLLSAMMGNCSARFVFRVSQQDAADLSQFLAPMSSKARLDELTSFRYRSIPQDRMAPDGVTVPREKEDEGIL
ncbi:hypothetical protein [Pontivivens insulae]|uniref:hypothetical protein n=1 Tax=Pontivivens insulae TaxID=1639689 RepID=UPI0011B25F7D|nr:hypothetical protein [Pontivivens insulae]